jgi:hypothetical protein
MLETVNSKQIQFNQVLQDNHIKDQISLVPKATVKQFRDQHLLRKNLDRESQEPLLNLMLWATMPELTSQVKETSITPSPQEMRVNGKAMSLLLHSKTEL